MQEYSEQDIINGCRNHTRSFQELLYKQYYSLFLKICARYAKDMEDAEQLLNDGFLKIFHSISKYEGRGSFEGWMKRVLVNTCLDYLKSKYLKNSMQMQVNPALVEESTISVDNNGLKQLEFKELVRMIQSLPAMTRSVFNLFVFEGFTHKQIGQLMGISESTSYWHVHHARTTLQQMIKKVHTQNPFYEHKRI